MSPLNLLGLLAASSLLTGEAPPSEPSPSPAAGWPELAAELGAVPTEGAAPEWPVATSLPERLTWTVEGVPERPALQVRADALPDALGVAFKVREAGQAWPREPAVTARFVEPAWSVMGADPALVRAVAELLGAPLYTLLTPYGASESSVELDEAREAWSWDGQPALRAQETWRLHDDGVINRCSCPITTVSGVLTRERVLLEDGWPLFVQSTRTLTWTMHAGGAVHQGRTWEEDTVVTWRRDTK